MVTRRLVACLVVALGGILAARTHAQTPQPPQQFQQRTFRAGTTLVPVDVRVVDWGGKPITDLTIDDFSLFENGIRQNIAHFATRSLDGDPVQGDAVLAATPDGAPVPTQGRVFLIVLANGNVQGPSKGLDALIGFLRHTLVPSDRVAIMSGPHASAFTTDHERLADSLVRMKNLSGGNATSMPEWNTLAVGGEDASQPAKDRSDPTLDDYVSNLAHDGGDLSLMYAAARFLQTVDGEKHIVYVTPFGMHWPPDHDDSLDALVASLNDSRIVLDTLQVGGGCTQKELGQLCDFNVADQERLSVKTGGVAGIHTPGTKVMTRVAQATSFEYELGYYPTNPTLDEKYRKITVTVNRSHVDVLYRHGYYAHDPPAALSLADLRRYGRVETAAMSYRSATGLPLTGVQAVRTASARSVDVHLVIDPSTLALTSGASRHTGTVDLAVFVADARGVVVGSTWHSVRLSLPDDLFARYAQGGMPLDDHVTVTFGAAFAKVILYDPVGDHVGSMIVPVTKPKS